MKRHAHTTQILDCHADIDRVVETRRFNEFDRDLADDEQHFVFALKLAIGKTEIAQPFGAGAFQKFYILRVIDHATGIGIFKVNALREIEREQRRLLRVF